jgi:hypothetical protein
MPVTQFESPEISKTSADREQAAKVYSRIAVHAAEVTDLLPYLNRLAQLQLEQASRGDIERARRRVTTHLQLATMEVSSIVAEIEC